MGVLSTSGLESLTFARGATLLLGAAFAFWLVRWIWTTIYNVWFHPLRHFPGPKRWLIFPITRQLDSVRGIREHKTLAYHEKYGNVVRSGPDMLTFTHPDAWKDIYGHGHAELPKSLGTQGGGVQNIINADAKTHFRYRRAMLPAFSDKALGEQEGIMKVYIDLLMKRLGEAATKSVPTDMVSWFNYTTFDLIGDLAFGEALGGLENSGTTTNAWLKRIKQSIRMLPMALLVQEFLPFLRPILRSTVRKSADEHRAMTTELVRKRIRNAEYGHRGDFMDQMMRSRGKEHELTDEEHAANADIMMVAGSETTATVLSGVTYLLLTHPEKMARMRE